MIDQSPDQEIPTLELYKEKKSQSRTNDVSETSFSSPSRHSKKSKEKYHYESESRKPSTFISATPSRTSNIVVEHHRNNSSSLESDEDSSTDEQRKITKKSSDASISKNNKQEEVFEISHQILEKPKPLPRKTLMTNQNVEILFEKPIPKARSVYNRQSNDEIKTEFTPNEIVKQKSVTKMSKSLKTSDDSSSKSDQNATSRISHQSLISKCDEDVKQIIQERSKSVGHRHQSKILKMQDVLNNVTPSKKSNKTIVKENTEGESSSKSDQEAEAPKPDENIKPLMSFHDQKKVVGHHHRSKSRKKHEHANDLTTLRSSIKTMDIKDNAEDETSSKSDQKETNRLAKSDKKVKETISPPERTTSLAHYHRSKSKKKETHSNDATALRKNSKTIDIKDITKDDIFQIVDGNLDKRVVGEYWQF